MPSLAYGLLKYILFNFQVIWDFYTMFMLLLSRLMLLQFRKPVLYDSSSCKLLETCFKTQHSLCFHGIYNFTSGYILWYDVSDNHIHTQLFLNQYFHGISFFTYSFLIYLHICIQYEFLWKAYCVVEISSKPGSLYCFLPVSRSFKFCVIINTFCLKPQT